LVCSFSDFSEKRTMMTVALSKFDAPTSVVLGVHRSSE